MDALTQLDAWLEDHLPANLAALPTRIADSLSSTSQIIIDSSHTVITTLTQYGPVFPSSSSSSPTASTTATNDDGLFDFWRTSPPPPSPPTTTPTTTATTTTDNNNKHSPLSLFTATASTATLIALGLTSLILIPPPRPGLKAHYGGPIWLPYLPGDLPTHIHSLFSSKKPPLRRQLSSSSAGGGARTEAVLVLGADTPLGRSISLHLATQGYIVLPVVSSPQALHTWAALTPPSSRGFIAPLLLPTTRDEREAASALEAFKVELEGVLGRRFPLTTAGEPYARPEEKIRLIGVVNTLSFFLTSSSTTDKNAVIQEQEEDNEEEDSQTSTPAESIILNQNITVTDSSVLSDHLYKHVVAPLSAIEIILPILRKHATPSSSTLLTSLILNLRAVGPEGGKMGRMEGIIHAALDRALDSLRVECVALDRSERPAKTKGTRRRSSAAAGGRAENAPSSSSSGGTYRPGQFDARFFVKVDLSRSKKDKDEEEQGGKKGKGKRRRRKDRSALDMNPSVKIVDMQLTDWERSSSSPPGAASTANVFTPHTQHPHPFQTRTTPASLALLTPLSDIVRLFGTVNTTRAGRCPETVILRVLPSGPASGGLAMVRRSIMENKIVTVLKSYLRSGLGVFGGGDGSVLAVGLGRSLRAFWGNMLGVVGMGGRRGRTLGGGGRPGRRGREGQVSGEMGLVRRNGSGGGEEDDEEGGGGYEILPSASSLGRTSFSQSQLPPGAGESASSSATLGPRGESSSTRTAIRPSPFSRQSQGPPLSTPSSPASSVRGMVLPPAPSASASPPTHPSNAPQQVNGTTTTGGGGGSATPLSLSASVMELPSSVPSSAYGGEEGEYDSYESGLESGVDVEEEEGGGEGRTPGVGEGVGEFAGFEERRDEAEGGGDGAGAAVLGDSWVAVSQSRSDVTTDVDRDEGEGEEKVEKGQDAA
ncbi:hypothetical protein CF327_g2832 [Tilletia walkeri]|nr:hypothetical protein CF327_g2832 [Tilletia walkeri]